MIRMSLVLACLCAAPLVAACSQGQSGIRVTNEAPATKPVTGNGTRREPVFYNGKTYQLDFVPIDGGHFAMAVNGMGKGQQKDAVAVATSSLRYFKCPDGQTGVLTNAPSYVEKQWRMSARCG